MRRWMLAALFIVFLLAASPLLRPYQHSGHSVYVDLTRAEVFHQSFANGDITPRWMPDFYYHYGSPIFNFYAPLTYYVTEAFRLLGFNGMWSLKGAYLFFWLLGALAMYFFSEQLIDRKGALAAAAAYTMAPYLLTDVYIRGALAEFSCFGLLPLVLWGIWLSGREKNHFGFLFASLAYAALIFSHNITAMITTPFLFIFALAASENIRAAVKTCFALCCGMLLTTFFWLPAVIEKSFVHATKSLTDGYFQFQNHFVEPAQLFIRKWSYGSSVPGSGDKMGFMFGEILWLGLLVGLIALILHFKRKEYRAAIVRVCCFAFAVICLGMTLPVSHRLWETLPLVAYVQFPWRFLLPASVFAAPLVATIPSLLHEKARPWASLILVIAVVAASFGYLNVRYMFHDTNRNGFAFVFPPNLSAAAHENNLLFPDRFLSIQKIRQLGLNSTASHDYLPVDCTRPPTQLPAEAAEAKGDDVDLLSSEWGYAYLRAEAQASVQQEVVFNHFYFPGWQAKIDGVTAPIKVEPETGRMIVTITPGRHGIELRFTDTPLRSLAKLISIFSLVILAVWVWIAFRIKGLS